MSKSRGILPPRRYWSADDLKALAELYPTRPTREIATLLNRSPSGVRGMANKIGLAKTPEFLKAECRLQKGSDIGIDFRFKKGLVPANKGLRRPGYSRGRGRMHQTQFKKGDRPHTWKPIGTILPDHAGYLRIKVRERIDGDAGGWNREIWPLVHHQAWERHKGPIPPKHLVVFKDRDRNNCAIENLELISMGENARRNRMWVRLPRELAEAIQLNGVLKRKLRKLYGQKQDERSSRSPVRDPRSA